jgi:hypothetical protein
MRASQMRESVQEPSVFLEACSCQWTRELTL